VELLTEEGISLVHQGRSLLSKGQLEAANELLVKSLKPLVGRISAEAELLTSQAKDTQMNGPEARQRTQNQVRYTLIAGMGFNVLLAVSLAIFFMKNIAKNVATVMDNTYRLARREQLNPPLPGNDEIAHLDKVLRDMALALDAANAKEHAIFENARDMICTITGGGVFSNVSPACIEILGYTPQELDGKWMVELVVEEDVQRTIELLKELFAGNCDRSFESRMKRKDGRVIHLLWSAQWSKIENCLFCVAHEITERKVAEELLRASEARIRLILESTPVGILTLDEDGLVQVGNPAIATMFGAPMHEYEGEPIVKLFKVSPDKSAAQFIRECVNKTMRIDAKTTAGLLFPAEVALKEFEGISGRQYLMVIQDISERHEIERMKQDFVAMVSHELRTPLTSVQGFLDLLAAGGYGEISATAQDRSGIASRNVSRLIDLINDILDAEKLESGKFEFRFSDVSMQKVVAKSVEAVRDFAEKSEVTIEVVPGDATTVADNDRLVQVVINLLSNAVKFSPKGSSISVSINEAPKYLEVSVSDNGAGIPEEARLLIFERFGQVRGAQSRHKGSGLGLAICKKIVEQHNGQIGVDSIEGQGSRFWFRLPTVMKAAKV
jgi:PAS domain S-box-containing protein